MTAAETAALIVSRWRLEHSVEAIMVACILLGAPIKLRSQVLAVVKAYVDQNTENDTYYGGM